MFSVKCQGAQICEWPILLYMPLIKGHNNMLICKGCMEQCKGLSLFYVVDDDNNNNKLGVKDLS